MLLQIFAGLCLNCAVFGALLRPLELVAVKMPPGTEEERNEDEADLDEDDEDDEGNNFTVLLPDGTHHENVVSQPPLTPNSSFHSHQVRYRAGSKPKNVVFGIDLELIQNLFFIVKNQFCFTIPLPKIA